MTEQELAALEALAKAATPGPWVALDMVRGWAARMKHDHWQRREAV